jgi:hypothetical protein
MPNGSFRWHIRFDTTENPDITIAVRMDPRNREPLDYYVFPRIDIASAQLRLAEENGVSLDTYHFDTLEVFYELTGRVSLAEVA